MRIASRPTNGPAAFASAPGRDEAEGPGDAAPDRNRDIVPDRIGEQQTLALAVLAHVADAIFLERLVHRTDARWLPVDADLAAGNSAEAEDAARELGAAGAHKAVESEDFALVKR